MEEPFKDFPSKAKISLILAVLLYLGAATWAVFASRLIAIIGLMVIFAAAGLVRRIPNPSGGANVPNMGLMIVAALLWSPSEVLIGVGIGSFVGLLVFWRTELWRASLNVVLWAPPAAAAATVGHGIIARMPQGLLPLTVAGVLAVATYRVLNMGLFAAYRNLRFGHPFLRDWLHNIATNWPSQLLSAPLAIVFAIIAHRLGTIEGALILTGASSLGLPIARQELAYYYRSQQMLSEIVEAAVRALEVVDPTARAHGDRVSVLAVRTGRQLGMPEKLLQALGLAARLHDVGLLAEPDESGRGNLAVIGGRILGRFPEPMIAEFVRAHRERWDGKDSPDGKQGKAIPLGARILAAAEIYDSALEGLPPFDVPLSRQLAASYLISLAGTVLDPKVVVTLLRVATEQSQEFGAAG